MFLSGFLLSIYLLQLSDGCFVFNLFYNRMLFDVYHNDRDINKKNESVSHSQPAIRIMIKELIHVAVFKIFFIDSYSNKI